MFSNPSIAVAIRHAIPILALMVGSASSAEVSVVEFSQLTSVTSGDQRYFEGPIEFRFASGISIPLGGLGFGGFGNLAPALGHAVNSSGMLFDVWGKSNSNFHPTYYISSLDIGPTFRDRAQTFTIAAKSGSGELQWQLGGGAQDSSHVDLSRVFTPDGRPLSTIAMTFSSWLLQNSYIDNVEFSSAPVLTTPSNIILPTQVVDGTFQFLIPRVAPGQLIFIDPVVATGYEYVKGEADPNFSSVILPNVGDGLYTIEFMTGTTLHRESLMHGRLFTFGNGGVSSFRVLDIEESAALDPNDPAAFVTGLMFAESGSFTGSMTPILAVPEPNIFAMFCCGLIAFGVARSKFHTIR